ncbi:MAG: replication protein [Methylocystis sp.]|nr:MAG: replication protein [Methylocystis sp.]
MVDQYDSFAALAAREIEGVHYRIHVAERSSPFAVVAPHGGWIEPGSSEAAMAIARETHSLYVFESLSRRARGDGLHITSTRFDEPKAMTLVEACEIVVSVHGRKNGADDASIWVGGLHGALRDAICAELLAGGFRAKTVGDGHPLAGRDPANICNKGRRGAGVQLELPRALRIRFAQDAVHGHSFAEAVRAALHREATR